MGDVDTASEATLRIGDVARRAGVSVRAVRYYEEQGILAAERSASGQRLYAPTAVDRVRFFQQMYAAGLTSRNIAELMPCWDSGHTDAGQRAMLLAQRDRIHSKVDELQDVLRRLDDLIAATATHP
jgi:DNA-binding transcriptional MerR regulator